MTLVGLHIPLRKGRALFADGDKWQGKFVTQVIDAVDMTVVDEWRSSKKSAETFAMVFNGISGVRVTRGEERL
jgi:hypothetical protein